MKKVIITLVALGFLAVVMTSCKSSQKCPAYGEHYKYQKEIKY